MKIVDHRLCRDDGTPYPFRDTPNKGAELNARWLVMHYTAGGSASESIGWLANPDAKASAHIVIAKDGSITQMVAFNRVAWHAGVSTWKGITGLNRHSIGIELDGFGIVGDSDGPFRAFGRTVPAEDVLVATHKNETKARAWARYPQKQLDVALELAKLLVRTYHLEDVIGHDDISPGRKQDPGPAFPMPSFRAAAIGQETSAPAAPSGGGARFRATTTVNVRSGPSASDAKVRGGPIPEGTLVRVVADRDGWKQVAVEGVVNSVSDVTGWVSAQYLQALPAFVTTDTLNVRSGPSGKDAKVPGGPFPVGTIVQELEDGDGWKHVVAPGAVNGVAGVTGWVSGQYLKSAALPISGISTGQPAGG